MEYIFLLPLFSVRALQSSFQLLLLRIFFLFSYTYVHKYLCDSPVHIHFQDLFFKMEGEPGGCS
jgi:hypothetical protein